MVSVMQNYMNKSVEDLPTWLNNFVETYQTLSTTNLSLLAHVYHKEVIFIDPMHHVEGFDNLSQYFRVLYQHLTHCQFDIKHLIYSQNEAAIYWQMSYKHPKLNHGNLVVVEGHSQIKGHEDKVIFHRDYLDIGAMLYEQLPMLGRLIKWIKARASR